MECYDPSITMEITDDGITIPKFLETGVEVVAIGDREIICWHSTKVADPNRQIKFRGHHWSRSDAPDYEKTGVLVGTLCRIVANCSDPIYITRPALLTAHEYCHILGFPLAVVQEAFARVGASRGAVALQRIGRALPSLMELAASLAAAPSGEHSRDRARLVPLAELDDSASDGAEATGDEPPCRSSTRS